MLLIKLCVPKIIVFLVVIEMKMEDRGKFFDALTALSAI